MSTAPVSAANARQRNQQKLKKSRKVKEINDSGYTGTKEKGAIMTFEETVRTNPFTPVFGKVPPFMAGREQVIDDITTALISNGNSPDICSLFVGARGTGKTALLTYLANEAEQQGWISARVTATSGMLEDILQRLHESATHLVDNQPARRLSSIEIAALGGLSWETAANTSANWRTCMNELFSNLEKTGTGVLMCVDEVNPELDEMEQLITTYQHFVEEDRRAMLLMAGLPHRVSRLLSGRATSFLRRAARHDLGPIPRYEVEETFRLTVESGGKGIDDEALQEAVDAIDGFPFMLQLVGYRAWNATGTSDVIDVRSIRRGIRLAQEELEHRVFDATLAELSKGDIAFLQAMVPDEKETDRADLTKRLKRSSSYISTYKKRLLEAGVIEERKPGTFTFALPGFRDYLRGKA